jgi:hypothetical protein
MENTDVTLGELEAQLMVILDQVDYIAGNCRVNEMVGAVLPKEVIKSSRVLLARLKSQRIARFSKKSFTVD